MFVFFLAVPQNCNPYVHIGYSSDLYINNLVFVLEHLLFVIKFLSDREWEFKINLFDLIGSKLVFYLEKCQDILLSWT